MRISVIRSDPGFRTDVGFYDVFFKGIMLRNVITADEEEKMVLCYVLDDRGKPIRKPDNPKIFLTEVKHGEVHIAKRQVKQNAIRN